jgi:hypothetical protein
LLSQRRNWNFPGNLTLVRVDALTEPLTPLALVTTGKRRQRFSCELLSFYERMSESSFLDCKALFLKGKGERKLGQIKIPTCPAGLA